MTERQKKLLVNRRLKRDGKIKTKYKKPRKSGGSESGKAVLTSENPPLEQNLEPANPLDGVLDVVERKILELVNVERVDINEVSEILNLAQATEAWNVERVAQVLAKARKKLERAGELEAARPNAYVEQDARERYDSIIRKLRAELKGLDNDELPEGTQALFAGARAKMLKTIAEVERMRDDVLSTLQGKSGPSAIGNLVYVSHLRTSGKSAALDGEKGA